MALYRCILFLSLFLSAYSGHWSHIETQCAHRGVVLALAVSPDGKFVASGGLDGVTRVLDPKNGRVLRTLPLPAARVNGLAFTADSRKLLIAAVSGRAHLWDLAADCCRDFSIPDAAGYCGAAVASRVARAAVGGDEVLRVFDFAAGTVLCDLHDAGRDRYWDVALAPTGDFIAGASDVGNVNIWSVDERRILRELRGHTTDVRRVWFSLSGELLISVDGTGTAIVWSAEDGKELRRRTGVGVYSESKVIAACDGTRFAFSDGQRTITVIDLLRDLEVGTLVTTGAAMTSLALGANSDLVVSGHEDGTVQLWDVTTGGRVCALTGAVATPRHVGPAPGGGVRVVVEDERRLHVVDLPARSSTWSSPAGLGRLVSAMTPDGKFLAFGELDQPIFIVNLEDGVTHPFEPRQPTPPLLAIANGGRRLALRRDAAEIILVEQGKDRPLVTLAGNAHTDVLALAFDFSADQLAMSGKGNFVRVVTVADGKVVAVPGRASGGTAKLPDHEQPVGWVASLAFNRHGAVLCGGPYATMVLRTPELAAERTFVGHTGSVTSTTFLAREDLIASIGAERSVRIWDVKSGATRLTVQFLGGGSWVATCSNGEIEATPGARDRLHRVAWTETDGIAVHALDPSSFGPELVRRAIFE